MSYFRRLGAALVGRPPASPYDQARMRSGHPKGQQKASALGPAIARLMLNMPVWPNRDYAQLGREGYQQNAIVYRSISLVAKSVAAITLELHQGRGKGLQTLEDHPLLELLRHPNPEQDGVAFTTSLVSHMLISGNGFLERTSEDNLERMELYSHRPDRVRVVPGPQGFAQAYEFRINGDIRRIAIDVDTGLRPILHLKEFHPVDDFYGMSPLDPGAWAIDSHNASGQFNKALLDNAATPSGAFVYTGNPEGGNRLGDDQYARLRAELEQSRQGAANAGRPMILEGGLDWKTMAVDPDRLQFVESKNQAAREIALALGVPPMLLGIPGDNTYANYAEANRAFYRQTVIPHARWLARALTGWFAEQLERDMRLEVDLDTIDALRSERMEFWAQVDKTTFLSPNEKRALVGYQPHDGGDDVYVGAGQIPLGDTGAIAGGAAPDDTGGDKWVAPSAQRRGYWDRARKEELT